MVDYGVPEDLIDWEQLLRNVPDDWNFDLVDDGPMRSTSPDSGCSLSLEGIEHYLLNDDDDGGCIVVPAEKDPIAGVVALDLPPESGSNQSKDTPSPETLTGEDGKDEEKAAYDGDDALNKADNKLVDEGDHCDENDPASKKRKRQMRNRDAAVRSRERKKMYVKDLEMKSKYYESECKRLGILLQCCMAENQALRLSLHSSKAYDASMTKQESAVLLLELLLLGSLLGSLGIIYHLLSRLLLNLEQPPLVGLELARVEPRTSKGFREQLVLRSSMMGKTRKASRTRIKPQLEIIV